MHFPLGSAFPIFIPYLELVYSLFCMGVGDSSVVAIRSARAESSAHRAEFPNLLAIFAVCSHELANGQFFSVRSDPPWADWHSVCFHPELFHPSHMHSVLYS